MMKCYKNIISEAVMIDIIPPTCPAYWKEISFHEFLEAVGEIKNYVLWCENQENKKVEEEEEEKEEEEEEEEEEEKKEENWFNLTEEEEIAYNKYDDERGAWELWE